MNYLCRHPEKSNTYIITGRTTPQAINKQLELCGALIARVQTLTESYQVPSFPLMHISNYLGVEEYLDIPFELVLQPKSDKC